MPSVDPYFLHVQSHIAELERAAARVPGRRAAHRGPLTTLAGLVRRATDARRPPVRRTPA
jgi:hypothetical protein